MRRFLLQMVAAVAVLVGLGLLDLGPRLRADHISFAELSAVMGAAGDDSEPPLGAPPTLAEAWPSPPPSAVPFDPVLLPHTCSLARRGGCSTAPSLNPSPVPDGSGLLLENQAPPPPLVTYLRVRQGAPFPDPCPSSIFHPPRPAARD